MICTSFGTQTISDHGNIVDIVDIVRYNDNEVDEDEDEGEDEDEHEDEHEDERA